MTKETRKVTTGKKGEESYAEKSYDLEIPESLSEFIDIMTGDDGDSEAAEKAVLEYAVKQYCVENDHKQRSTITTVDTLLTVPTTPRGAFRKFGTFLASGDLEAAKVFYMEAVKTHPEMAQLVAANLRTQLGIEG